MSFRRHGPWVALICVGLGVPLVISAAPNCPTLSGLHLRLGAQCVFSYGGGTAGGVPLSNVAGLEVAGFNDALAPISPAAILGFRPVFTPPRPGRIFNSVPAAATTPVQATPQLRDLGTSLPEPASQVNIVLTIKPMAAWRDNFENLNLGISLGATTVPSRARLRLMTVRNGQFNADLQVVGGATLAANVAASAVISPDRWHVWEIMVTAPTETTGALVQWYVDGQLQGRHGGVNLWPGAGKLVWVGAWIAVVPPRTDMPWLAYVDDLSAFASGTDDRIVLTNDHAPLVIAASAPVLDPADDPFPMMTPSVTPPEQTAVLVDGRQATGATCENDVVRYGTSPFVFTNLAGIAGCSAYTDGTAFATEVAVFSRGDRFSLIEQAGWTDDVGEKVTVVMEEPRVQNLTIRIAPEAEAWFAAAEDRYPPGTERPAEAMMRRQVAEAQLIYDLNRTGITFEATYLTITDADALRSCADVVDPAPASFTANQSINIYVTAPTASAGPDVACNCSLGLLCNGIVAPSTVAAFANNVVLFFANKISYSNTLAHEIGHAMSLLHSEECYPDAAEGSTRRDNLLYFDGRESKWALTLGQAYRANMNVNSVLNLNGLRTGLPPARSCPEACTATGIGASCPGLKLN